MCSTKSSQETLQNLPYFWNKKTQTDFSFSYSKYIANFEAFLFTSSIKPDEACKHNFFGSRLSLKIFLSFFNKTVFSNSSRQIMTSKFAILSFVLLLVSTVIFEFAKCQNNEENSSYDLSQATLQRRIGHHSQVVSWELDRSGSCTND